MMKGVKLRSCTGEMISAACCFIFGRVKEVEEGGLGIEPGVRIF